MKRIEQRITQARTLVLNSILPPLCPVTDLPVSAQGALHPTGWARLHFIADPCCAACGLPFDLSINTLGAGQVLCGACASPDGAPMSLTGKLYFDRLRAVVRYNDESARLVLSLKNADRMEIIPVLAGLMRHAGKALLAESDILMPVPLHRRRLFARRFNQAAELARAIARDAGMRESAKLHMLKRIKATAQQKDLTKAQRQRNVQGAFRLAPGCDAQIAGKTITLIDDVLTTGATMKACARVLKQAGAAKVNGLVFARVVKDGTTDYRIIEPAMLKDGPCNQ